MRDSLTLGRIAGIRFGVNWSWVIVFALIVWTLATGHLSEHEPRPRPKHIHRHGDRRRAPLLHLAARCTSSGTRSRRSAKESRSRGSRSGSSAASPSSEGMFPSAGAEFRIAIAGPLVSLALGAIFVLLAWKASLPEVADGVAAWLGYINLTLLVFNLLPALPLDGGRVLRSALWGASGNLGWATHVAALIGRGFGYLFIVGGVALVIWQSAYSGIWIAFVGWFLLQAAGGGGPDTARPPGPPRAAGPGRGRPRSRDDAAPTSRIGEFMDDIAWTTRHATYPVTENGHVVGLLPSPLRRRGAAQRMGDAHGARLHAPAGPGPGRPRGRRPFRRRGRDLRRRPLARARPRRRPLRGLLSWSDVRRALELRRARRR